MPRCFFALPLPVDAARLLAAFTADLAAGQLAPARPRPLDAPDLHLTLRFLGAVDDAMLATLEEGMHRLATSAPPLGCSTEGITIWPTRRQPRVLVTGVRSQDPLAALAADFEHLAQGLGFAPEPRRFRAHLTLARFRSGTGPLRGALPEAPALDFTANRVELWESLPQPGAARYRALAASALSVSSSGSR